MQRASAGALTVLLCLLAACSSRANAPKTLVLNGFERVPDSLMKRQFDPAEAIKHTSYPSHDFDVATSGYAKLVPISKDDARKAKDKELYKFIQGKGAAKVRFTVPTDYKKRGDGFPKVWETGFGMAIDSHTPLASTDWSIYKYLSLRVFNPGPLTQTVQIRFSDSSSGVTGTSVAVPLGESELELPLELLGTARLNSADMKGLSLFMDTVGQDVDPVLIVDELALQDTDAATRARLAAEEGAGEEDDEDWDSDDEETVRKVRVVRPGQVLAEPAAVSGPASAQ